MPTYLHCPHCEHPQIIPGRRLGKTSFCRQCGWAYQMSPVTRTPKPLAISSVAELKHTTSPRRHREAFVLEV